MNIKEALELLSFHSGYHEDTSHEKSSEGFLGQLRPYDGQLFEDNFLELLTILDSLGLYYKGKQIEKEILAMLFDICTMPRLWAFDPKGMLRRNNLIEDKDLSKLNDWLIRLSEGVSCILNDQDIDIEEIMVGYGDSDDI